MQSKSLFSDIAKITNFRWNKTDVSRTQRVYMESRRKFINDKNLWFLREGMKYIYIKIYIYIYKYIYIYR